MQAKASVTYDVLTVQRSQKLYIMARVTASGDGSASNRRPLNLSLVLDRSGSMAGAKLDYTRQASQFLIQHLSPEDILSVVLYNDKVETLFEPQHVTNKDALSQQIETIKPRGTTNLSGGWLEGCQHVRQHYAPTWLNRVILLSDGLANRGITDRAQLVAIARQQYEAGITTTTMGLGNDFNEDLLMEIASAGGGAFYFIESPEVAPEIFNEELTGLMRLAVQNLTVRVTVTDQVKDIRQLNAYPVKEMLMARSYRLGDLYSGEVKTLVLELTIPSLSALGQQQIAAVHFAYDELTPNGIAHHEGQIGVQVNMATSAMEPAPEQAQVTQAVLLLQAANARQEAIQRADRGQFDEASRVLKAVASEIAQAPITNEQLQEEQRALLAQADALMRGEAAYNEYSRKTLSTQAYYTMQSRHQETMLLRLRESERSSAPSPNANPSATSHLTYPPTRLRPLDGLTPPPAPQTRSVLRSTPPTVVEWRGREFPLTGDVIRIGRAIHNEIVIEESGVSRFHSQIRRDGDSLWIEDLGSTNGTLVGGERLTGPYRLSVGDIVYVCDEKLVFK
ncbi:MAG: VWA domain-containing protein [Aggregatilineales bacterium]